MKRFFYVKDEHGEFTKVLISPIIEGGNTATNKFHITSDQFNGIIERNEMGEFNYPDTNRLLLNITYVIKRYYEDLNM